METDEDLAMSLEIFSRLKKGILIAVLIITLVFHSLLFLNAQTTGIDKTSNPKHELTIYVLKSASPLNWDSPETIYKTYRNSVLINFMKKERTLKGHFFIRLSTPLIEEPLYAGITSVDRKEEKKLMYIKKIGLSVFGATMKGTIQGREVLEKKIAVHTQNNDIAYMKIKLSKSAAQRIIDFYSIYTTDFISDYSPSDFYGGAFWPRYENEGAGCSSFVLAILDLIHVKDFETDQWQKTVKIPMDLMGGEINNSKKVKVRNIKHTKSWYNGDGEENIDFVPFNICDPSTAYYWILEHRMPEKYHQDANFIADTESGIPGLFVDYSQVEIDLSEPIILKRPDKNFFVEYHQSLIKKIKGMEPAKPLVGLKFENTDITSQYK